MGVPKIDTVEDGFCDTLTEKWVKWTQCNLWSLDNLCLFSHRRPRIAAERLYNEGAAGQQVHNQVAIGNPPANSQLRLRLQVWSDLILQASSMNHDATASLYRFNATNGITCILMQVDGLISIRYRNKLNEDVEADLYMPDDPQLSGECVESNVEILTMDFKGFRLSMTFKKVRGYVGWANASDWESVTHYPQ